MPNPSPYFPFNTTDKLAVQPSSLLPLFKKAIIKQAKAWSNGHKLKKGSIFSFTYAGETHSTVLENSIVKIEDDVYVMHRKIMIEDAQGKIKTPTLEGSQGKIKVVESLSDKRLSLVKISYISAVPIKSNLNDIDELDDLLNEVEVLSDAGMCQGQAQRTRPSQAGLCKAQRKKLNAQWASPNEVSKYFIKRYTVMPYLGRDLKEHLKELAEKQTAIPDEVCFDIEIQALWELTKWHLGLAFISGEGRMHRDIKPANMVLNHKGVRFIDFGFAEKNPEAEVYATTGTLPYIVIAHAPDYFPQRTGQFFDMDAMRRTSYGPLCDTPIQFDRNGQPIKSRPGILTKEVVRNYNIKNYLEQAYSTTYNDYLEECELNINDPMTLTAVMIGLQARLTHEQLGQIINNSDLAATVVGTYFSNQVDWLEDGSKKLGAVLNLSDDVLERQAGFVRLGLSHKLNEGLENKRLCGVLDSNSSRDIKRAAICLFQRDLHLWDEDACKRLHDYSDFAVRCLKAHYNEDEFGLLQLLCRENIAVPPVVAQVIDPVYEVLKTFPLTPEDMLLLDEHVGALRWFYAFINTHLERGLNRQIRHDLNTGARLYTFLNNAAYRKAVLIAYDWDLKGFTDDVETLLQALISALCVDTAEMIAALESKLSRSQLCACLDHASLRLSTSVLSKHPQLVREDLAVIFKENSNADLLMSILRHLEMKISQAQLTRLVELQQMSNTLFLQLFDKHGQFQTLPEEPELFQAQTTERLVEYMLSADNLAPYLFEAGQEQEKIRVFSVCLTHNSFRTTLIGNLSNTSFLKATVVLMQAKVLTRENLDLLGRDRALELYCARSQTAVLDC